ncbi:MAG: glycerol-3-phosphate acyltransferase [Ignavibacteriales bacterium]|nr:glycerol-3-phosphate acyltransferase [Ignavibacteriales bacterium]
MLEVVATFVVSYLVGSIPVGQLIVRRKADVDILESGSGRSGGFNAFVVTKSKYIGILVGALDALKGFLVVLAAGVVFPQSLLHDCVSLFGVITGHNYPVWTKFRGGRGLSTAAGGMFILGFSYTIVWCMIWFLTKVGLKRDILVSNITAIMLTPPVLWLLPWDMIRGLLVGQFDQWTFLFFSCTLSMVLLLSHIDAMTEIWKGSETEHTNDSTPQS